DWIISKFGVGLSFVIGEATFCANDVKPVSVPKQRKEETVEDFEQRKKQSEKQEDERLKNYQKIQINIENQIEKKKFNLYSAQLQNINEIKGNKVVNKKVGRECDICHQISDKNYFPYRQNNYEEFYVCELCGSLIGCSKAIVSSDYCAVGMQEDKKTEEDKNCIEKFVKLPIFGDKKFLYFAKESEDKNIELTQTEENKSENKRLKDFKNILIEKNIEIFKIYKFNTFGSGSKIGTKIWLGNYPKKLTEFENYIDNDQQGINRIGCLRVDIDNLGQTFREGFIKKDNGDLNSDRRYNTLSRTATLSRSIAIFFKYYVNWVLQNPRSKILVGDKTDNDESVRKGRNCQIIYSGGDDMFIVGAWDDVLEFAIDLHYYFNEWSLGKMTISAGFGMFPQKFPVSQMARITGILENKSKNYKNGGKLKNAICLFEDDDDNVFSWDEFTKKVIEKYKILSFFFDNYCRSINSKYKQEKLSGSELVQKYGQSFIFNLLDLIRQKENSVTETVSSARWIYFLTRMEPKLYGKNLEEDKIIRNNFMELAENLRKWFKSEKDFKQLKMAIYLYVYSVRKTENKNLRRK
ncbi:MAG: type III-A CRISPR-associated protein Cas10/Csm1, partial [Candidatus Ancillula sp.]|nr:type III-A CRISPR-associated protein Cas10/Csm1 [Candidatus Ancillula sp.]